MLCSKCNKNQATIFINEPTSDDPKKLVGYCKSCAKEKGIKLTSEIPQIQKELSELQEAVLVQNEKNRTLLKEHITQIRNRISQFSDPRHNPYAKNTSIYSQKVSTPSIIDIEI